MPYPDRPIFKIPAEIDPDTGLFAVVELDSDEEITQSVHGIILTELGSRIEAPGIGVPDPTFREITADGIDLEDLIDAVLEQEPRARTAWGQDVAARVRGIVEVTVSVSSEE